MNVVERRLLDTVEFSSYIASFADPNRQVLAIEPYVYSVDEGGVNITSAAAQSFDLVMDSDSDFILCTMSGAAVISVPAIAVPANGNTVTEFSPALLIQITDQASGKTYFNIPTPLALIAGAGGYPFILSSPRIVRPRTTLSIAAQGAVAGVTYERFMFSLHGAKIYYAGPTT